jgi:hypothetical protein
LKSRSLLKTLQAVQAKSRRTITVHPDIHSEFSASVTEGCHPLSVDFTNLSNGAGYYIWDFDDGASSSLVSPTRTFTNTGTVDSVYTVKLLSIAPNNVCRDSFFIDIRVHPYVKADFTIPVSLDCNPFDVILDNNSVNGINFLLGLW